MNQQHPNESEKKPEWIGLTPEDWRDMAYTLAFREGAEWAEKILREKNLKDLEK